MILIYYTLYLALQILLIADYDLSQLPIEDITHLVQSLQQEDGSFVGNQWGAVDTRFSY